MDSTELDLVPRNSYLDEHPHTQTLAPLPPHLRQGLIAIAVAACISLITTLTLFIYISYKLISWRLRWRARLQNVVKNIPEPLAVADFTFEDGTWVSQAQAAKEMHERSIKHIRDSKKEASPNQFLLLIYMLVLADMHEAVPFAMSFAWVSWNGIYVNTAACWIEAYTQINGDLSSSIFITWIAIHTYMSVVKGYQIPQRVLCVVLISTWIVVYAVSTIPILATMNGRRVGGYFVRSGPWCWITSAYDEIRLFTHNIWIFVSIAVVSALYLAIYISLRRKSKKASGNLNHPGGALARAEHNPAFLIYPIVYIICNLPLAAGRFLRMVHVSIPNMYLIIAGVLVSLSGFFDVLVFGITRQSIVFGSTDSVEDRETGLSTFKFTRTPRSHFGNEVWIEGGVGQNESEESWEGVGGWWQSLRGERPTLGSIPARGNNDSQESLRRGEASDMAIHMDIVTTVHVEVDQLREHDTRFPSSVYQPKRSEDSHPPSLPSLKEWDG